MSEISFDGSQSILFSKLIHDITNDFSIDFWVKPNKEIVIAEQRTIGIAPYEGQSFVIGPNHGQIQNIAGIGLSVGTNGIAVYEHTTNHFCPTLVFKTKIDKWSHVVLVFHDSQPSLYLNGALAKTSERSSKLYTICSGEFGALAAKHSLFEGTIRDFRIWKQPLSQLDILLSSRNVNNNFAGLYGHLTSSGFIPVFQEKERQENNYMASIVIPVFNNWKLTADCIQSILDNTSHRYPYEIIVADDASSESPGQMCSRLLKNARLIKSVSNQGFVGNCNHAAGFASGKYLVFLNNDTLVHARWLESLIEIAEATSSVGIVGSKIIDRHGKLMEAGCIVFQDGSAWNFGRNDNPAVSDYNYVKEVDYVSGASLLIAKSLWKTIGGFDTRFSPAYYEDVDIAFEARKNGYKVLYQPASVITHLDGQSYQFNKEKNTKDLIEINKKKLKIKWVDELDTHDTYAQSLEKNADRGYRKKVVLVIDHYVPAYDRDCGSRSCFQYLKLLVEMGFCVKFFPDNCAGWEPYTSEMEQLGIQVLYGAKYAKAFPGWLQDHGMHIDYCVVYRPHITKKYLDLIKKYTRAKIVYVAVDLHYLRETRKCELYSSVSAVPAYQLKEELDIFLKSDITYLFSDFERQELLQKDPKIQTRVVPLYQYDFANIQLPSHRDRTDSILFVGGFGHPPNMDGLVWFIDEILPRVRKSRNVKFLVIGSNPSKEIIEKCAANNIEMRANVSDEELKEAYRTSAVSVAPLRYGAGMKGKIVESIVSGIPVVTTSIGAEGFFDASSIMEIANDSEGFAKSVISLLHDRDMALEKSMKAYFYAVDNFSKNRAIKCVLEDMQPWGK